MNQSPIALKIRDEVATILAQYGKTMSDLHNGATDPKLCAAVAHIATHSVLLAPEMLHEYLGVNIKRIITCKRRGDFLRMHPNIHSRRA